MLAIESLTNGLSVEQDDGEPVIKLLGDSKREVLADNVGPFKGDAVPTSVKVAPRVTVIDFVPTGGVGVCERVCKGEGVRLPPQ